MKKNAILESVEQAEQVAENAKSLMSATANIAEDKVIEARKRLGAALERAQEVSKEIWNDVQDKAVTGARVADETIVEHRYQALGIALGVGALVGFLLSRRD